MTLAISKVDPTLSDLVDFSNLYLGQKFKSRKHAESSNSITFMLKLNKDLVDRFQDEDPFQLILAEVNPDGTEVVGGLHHKLTDADFYNITPL